MGCQLTVSNSFASLLERAHPRAACPYRGRPGRSSPPSRRLIAPGRFLQFDEPSFPRVHPAGSLRQSVSPAPASSAVVIFSLFLPEPADGFVNPRLQGPRVATEHSEGFFHGRGIIARQAPIAGKSKIKLPAANCCDRIPRQRDEPHHRTRDLRRVPNRRRGFHRVE